MINKTVTSIRISIVGGKLLWYRAVNAHGISGQNAKMNIIALLILKMVHYQLIASNLLSISSTAPPVALIATM